MTSAEAAAPAGSALRGRVRTIVTPEGVPIRLEVAPLGSRIAAQLLDQFIVWAGMIGGTLIAYWTAVSSEAGWVLALGNLFSFLWYNGYFVGCELFWAGQTIGKRQLGIRVVSRDGRPLTAEALIARNLTRNLETLLPLVVLLAPQAVLPGAPAWAAIFGLLWIVALALLPVFNRDHLRVGDLIGGTIVVTKPRTQLLDDLTDEEVIRWGRTVELSESFRFTPEQLDIYGVHELQTLENVLRDYRDDDEELLRRVAEAIKKKIDWPLDEPGVDDEQFLLAFYRAQRARLEHGLLFGKRRASKHDRS